MAITNIVYILKKEEESISVIRRETKDIKMTQNTLNWINRLDYIDSVTSESEDTTIHNKKKVSKINTERNKLEKKLHRASVNCGTPSNNPMNVQ